MIYHISGKATEPAKMGASMHLGFLVALLLAGAQFVHLPAQAQAAEAQAEDEESPKPRPRTRHRHSLGHVHDHEHEDAGHRHGRHPLRKATALASRDERKHAHGVETEGLFAFVAGSDIGEGGEKHLTLQLDGAFKKRDGTFRAVTPKIELGYNPTDRLHVALEFWGDHFKVRNNSDFDDQSRWGAGLAFEIKTLLARRGEGLPFGVALLVAPHYGTSEHVSGEPAAHYALEMKLISDVELVKDRVFAAFNLLYEPEKVRPRGEEWEKESLFGASAAIMARLSPALFAGTEVQYLRKFEGYFFNTFVGHALYVGPALNVRVGEHASLSLGWAMQIVGKAVDDPRSLDVVNFERHRGTLSFSAHF
jgi:hypothetical protein